MITNRLASLILILFCSIPFSVSAHCGGKHTGDHPHCSGGGGGGGEPAGNPSFVYSTAQSNQFMRVMDADGSNDRVLSKTLGAGGGVFGPQPSWAPTRDEVAWVDKKFRKPSGIVVFPLDGNAYAPEDACAGETLCLLFENTSTFEAGGGGGDTLDWGNAACPIANGLSGRYIAFIGLGDFHVNDDDDFDTDLFLINRDDPATLTAPINVTNQANEDLRGVAWSSDGQRIAVYAHASGVNGSPNGNIAIIDVCDGFARQEVQLPVNDPIQSLYVVDWAQDGSDRLAVSSSQGVWIVDFTNSLTAPTITAVEGISGPLQLNETLNATWSPNGNELAISFVGSDDIRAVAIIDVSTTSITSTLSGTSPGRIDWRLEDPP